MSDGHSIGSGSVGLNPVEPLQYQPIWDWSGEWTDRQKLESLLAYAQILHNETGKSYDELMGWSPEFLYQEAAQYSGLAVSFEPVVHAFVIAQVAVMSLGFGLALGSALGITFSLSGALALAGNTAIRAMTYQAIRAVNKIPEVVLGSDEENASVDDVRQWIEKLLDATGSDADLSPVERANRQFEYETFLENLRTQKAMATETPVDLNADSKVNAVDFGIAAKMGGFRKAASAIGVIVESERAVDISGQGPTGEPPVVGDEGYEDVTSGGAPLKTGSVRPYPKGFDDGGGNMAFYQNRYGFRGRGKWVAVAPGTPGAFPSKINPGQWIMRRY